MNAVPLNEEGEGNKLVDPSICTQVNELLWLQCHGQLLASRYHHLVVHISSGTRRQTPQTQECSWLSSRPAAGWHYRQSPAAAASGGGWPASDAGLQRNLSTEREEINATNKLEMLSQLTHPVPGASQEVSCLPLHPPPPPSLPSSGLGSHEAS